MKKFAKAGARVCFTYLYQQEEAKETERLCCDCGNNNVQGYCVDGKNEEEIRCFIESVIQLYGRIDILINNAGFISRRLFCDMNNEVWNKSIETNLNATMYYCKYVLNIMTQQEDGSIVNISTVCAEQPIRGQAAYSTTKSAIESFSKVLALEYGQHHIRVNVVSPGFILSGSPKHMTGEQIQSVIENIPLKRAGYSEDVANAVLFLASNKASYITGSNINVSGGNHLKS